MIVLLLAINPSHYIACALNGLSAWAFNVLPCIFPFMVLTRVIIELDQTHILTKPFSKFFEKIYGVPSQACSVFFLSVLAGYPVGSKMTADLYEQGKINRTSAYKMSSFCSNSGPMFIVGTVGSILLKNAMVGFILFVSHIASALLNGLLYRKIKVKNEEANFKNFIAKPPSTFGDIILSSVQSVLSVGGVICLFFIIIEVFLPILSFLPKSVMPLGEGMIELTRGCIDAATLPLYLASIICSFLISFGGISTILQSMAMLKKLKMPVWLFSVQKLSQGLISAGITSILMLLI